MLVLRVHPDEDPAPPARGARSRAQRPGAAEAITGELDVERVFWWRDQVTDGRDDSWHADWIAEQEPELVRGEARVVRPGVVAVGEREIAYGHLVVATGSSPEVPPVDGLGEVDYWTNRDAVWARRRRRRASSFSAEARSVGARAVLPPAGLRVTILESHDRSARAPGPVAGTLLRERFEDEGIGVSVEVQAKRVERRRRESASTRSGDVVGRSSSRRDRTYAERDGLGLEQLGVELTKRGIPVDERMRAGEDVWAIGDPSGVRSSRTSASTRRGWRRRTSPARLRADYRAIPAAVFTDPQIASVDAGGRPVVTAEYRIEGGRLSTYERPKRPGLVKLAADRTSDVLVGAVAVGPEAGEWIGQLTLAVRARVPSTSCSTRSSPTPRSPRRSSGRCRSRKLGS